MRPACLFVLALVVGWTLAVPASADVVHLKTGQTLEGEVIDRGEEVEVKLKYGSTIIKKDEIESIERVQSPVEVYRERAGALKPEDSQGHFQLAQWCREQGLAAEARTEFLKTIDIDPNHAQARAALGYVKVGTEWVDTTTTSLVTVENQMPVTATVLVDDQQVLAAESEGSGQFATATGEHQLQVALGDERKLTARVALPPRSQGSLVIPVPQPEHLLRISRDGFYLFPSEIGEFVYRRGLCTHATLTDGATLSTVDGSPAPGPTSFEARELGESLGFHSLFAEIVEVLGRRRAPLRADAAGAARVQLAPGLTVLLDKDDLEDLQAGDFEPSRLRLLCEQEARYRLLESVEAGSEFDLDEDGDVTITLGSLLVKVHSSALSVRPTDSRQRGEYAIAVDSLLRLSRGSGRRATLAVEEGSVKALGGDEPPESPRPPPEGEKPRLPRGAILWGPAGYTVTRQLDNRSSRTEEVGDQTTFYSEHLIVVLNSQPL